MLITLPPATNAEWGDEIYIEKSRSAGPQPVTVGGVTPAVVLRAPGDWLVVKAVGSTIKSWEPRHRGDFQMVEDTIPGALTVDGRHVGRMLRYTGTLVAGHTWTLNQAGMVGSVSVVNDGTGPITILNGSATISGALEVPAGSKGAIIYSQQGVHATTLSEKMRLSTGSSAAVPFSPQTPFSINQLLATSGPIPAAGFGIWPNSGQDETARIVTALTALANEGPAVLVGGRKRSLGFANGVYLVSNLADTTTMRVVGEHGTVFQYNGASGIGTHIWRVNIATADARANYAKFERVRFNGQSPGAAMPEMGVWMTATGPNWATAIESCHFYNIGLTPVRLTAATTFSAVDCRADSFGGSMIVIDQPQTRESTIAVERGSCSWLDPANIGDWVTQGYIPGRHHARVLGPRGDRAAAPGQQWRRHLRLAPGFQRRVGRPRRPSLQCGGRYGDGGRPRGHPRPQRLDRPGPVQPHPGPEPPRHRRLDPPGRRLHRHQRHAADRDRASGVAGRCQRAAGLRLHPHQHRVGQRLHDQLPLDGPGAVLQRERRTDDGGGIWSTAGAQLDEGRGLRRHQHRVGEFLRRRRLDRQHGRAVASRPTGRSPKPKRRLVSTSSGTAPT